MNMFMFEAKAAAVKQQIVVAGVSHLYRPARGRAVLALEDISLDIAMARRRLLAWHPEALAPATA